MGWNAGPALIAALLTGLGAGVASYTFIYAKGYSYLTNDPAACANCHVMQEQYDGWVRASHRSVAGCNDCHTPPSFVRKYLTKGSNGFWHSFAFTSGRFHEPIRIKEGNREVTEEACRNCHEAIVRAMSGYHDRAADVSCVRCHDDVGHPH